MVHGTWYLVLGTCRQATAQPTLGVSLLAQNCSGSVILITLQDPTLGTGTQSSHVDF